MDDALGAESDDTLMDDGIIERATPFRYRARRRRRSAASFQIETFQDNSHRILQTHSYDGRTLRHGKTVELTDGTFLRIKTLFEDRRSGGVFLKGFRYQRASSLGGLLEHKRNEVARILKLDKSDRRDILEVSTETIELSAVVKIRELVNTNQQFPALSYRETDPGSQMFSKDFIYDRCRLICRWNYVKVSRNEGFLKRMTEEESDKGYAIRQDILRYGFRGPTTKGGEGQAWQEAEEGFHLKERMRCFFIDPLRFHSLPANRHRSRQQPYTFGDAFCGCGGASRGAYGARLRIAWGFDQDAHAIATYYANFPHSRCEGITANDFITALNEDYKVDILHLSPPCQTFSPAHTHQGRNDESNEASFLATEELLKKTRPRIVTLEETFGITRSVGGLVYSRAQLPPSILTQLMSLSRTFLTRSIMITLRVS